MKTKHIFWGLFFVALGAILVLHNFNIIPFYLDWHNLWHWWPLILIALGINSLIKAVTGQKLVWFMPAFFILFFMLCFNIFQLGFLSSSGREEFREDEHVTGNSQHFYQEYDASSDSVTFEFEGGAMELSLNDTSSYLIDANARTSAGEYVLERTKDEGQETLKLRLAGKHIRFHRNMHNEVAIKLHPNPVWNINMEFGAGKADLDFSRFNVSKLSVEAGAADIEVKLGDLSPLTIADIETGAASVNVKVPATVGCQIDYDAGLSSKKFEGFTKTGENTYQTENFSSAEKKILIRYEGGVSSVRVKRY